MTKPNILIFMVDQLNGTLFPDGPADWLHTPNLRKIAELLPKQRQTLLFSATVTVPSLAMWLSTTSQICGPSVSSLTLAHPATT